MCSSSVIPCAYFSYCLMAEEFTGSYYPPFITEQGFLTMPPPAGSVHLHTPCLPPTTTICQNLVLILLQQDSVSTPTPVSVSPGSHTDADKAYASVPSRSVVSSCLQPQGLQPTRLLCPWGFSRQEYWSGLPCPPLTQGSNPGLVSCITGTFFTV